MESAEDRIKVGVRKTRGIFIWLSVRQLCSVLLHFSVALAAIDGSVAVGLEGNLSFLAASRAGGGVKLSLGLSGVLSGLAASLTSLGLVLEPFLGVELLLACGEDELRAAILTD